MAVRTQLSRNDVMRIQTHPDMLVNEVLLREPMTFGTQDLLVLFLSTGMALFALNVYKITTAGAKG